MSAWLILAACGLWLLYSDRKVKRQIREVETRHRLQQLFRKEGV